MPSSVVASWKPNCEEPGGRRGLQREMEAPDRAKRGMSWKPNWPKQAGAAQLRHDLEESQKHSAAHKENFLAEQSGSKRAPRRLQSGTSRCGAEGQAGDGSAGQRDGRQEGPSNRAPSPNDPSSKHRPGKYSQPRQTFATSQALTETLAQETRRREGAEQQAGEISQRRSDLEAELARLRQELKPRKRNCKQNRIAPPPNKPGSKPG